MASARISQWFLVALVAFSPAMALAGSPLLIDTPAPVESGADTSVLRQRHVLVNLAALNTRVGRTVEIPLFDGSRLQLVQERLDPSPRGFVWVGHVAGQPQSLATLSVVDGVLSANISTAQRDVFQIRFAGSGLHVLRQMDSSRLRDHVEPLPSLEAWIPSAAEPQGSTLDVVAVYTPAARSAARGTSAIASLIHLAASEANTLYALRGIPLRLRVVHSAEVGYSESGLLRTDLSRLQASGDFYMDGVHVLRDSHQAQLVSLFVSSDASPCDSAVASGGFLAVDLRCSTGGSRFGRALEHTARLDLLNPTP